MMVALVAGSSGAYAAPPKADRPPPVPSRQHIVSPTDQIAKPAELRKAASANGPAPFLTRPYWNYHAVTSVFDHCNPDYSHDGSICEVDGTVARASNGVDPTFTAGYAITPGGQDYLYYDGHNGWDIALNYETLLAAADGTVILAGCDPNNGGCGAGFGLTVTIDHGNGFTTRYGHMSQIYVVPGQVVTRGQVIGVSGNTGASTGPHLHFGLYLTQPWTAIDPWGWSGGYPDPWPSDSGDLWITGNPQNPVPWAPQNVSAVAGVGSATVNWTAPSFDGGSGVSSYTVTASSSGPSVTVSGSQTSTVVTGLVPGTLYTFTVTASNGVGTGPASVQSNPVMAKGTPVSSCGAPSGTCGYSILTAAGAIYSFGTARYYGNLLDHGYPGPAVSIGEMPGGDGYQILTAAGGLYSFGFASGQYRGNLIDHGYPGTATAMGMMPDGAGYQILTSSGALYSFGSAAGHYYGNLLDHGYPGPAVGLAMMPDGNGYAILTGAGALYTFGSAAGHYYGNLIDHHYPGTAVAIAMTRSGLGYSILTDSGAIYSFGDATYYGNLLDHGYPGPAVSLGDTP
ncbi:MAG TPA: peptidoglycan DD-metalloendopeptidase family protein [Candidatus Dormibacteraeota bacterium]